MKRIILSFLVLLGSTSCGQKSKLFFERPFLKSEVENKVEKKLPSASLQEWLKLIKGETPNIALAELLSQSVANDSKEEIKELVSRLSENEIAQILSSVEASQKDIENQLVFHRSEDKALEAASIFRSELFKQSETDSYLAQVKIQTYAYIQNKALNEILSTYQTQVQDLTRPIALASIKEYLRSNPSDAIKLERIILGASDVQQVAREISKSLLLAQKVGAVMAGLSYSEQAFAMANFTVVGIIYTEIKDKKSFKNILDTYKEIKTEIDHLKSKAQAINLFVSSLDRFHTELENTHADFARGLKGINEDYLQIKAVSGQTSFEAKKVYNNIYQQLFKGAKPFDASRPSFNIENIKICTSASIKMANSLGVLTQATRVLAKELNVRIPQDLEKVLETSEKVARTVSLVSGVINGFASGGILGATAALTKSLGLATDPVYSKLAMIDSKMDQLLEGQKEMLKLQEKTMSMIKELAVLVDANHQVEMEALSEIKEYTLAGLEISKSLLHEDLRFCEMILAKQFSKDQKNINFLTQGPHSFYESFQNYGDIQKFIRGLGENSYSSCQDAMAKAFGGASEFESPLRITFETDETHRYTKFATEVYSPLLARLKLGLRKNDAEIFKAEDVFLNVPVQSFDHLKVKKNAYQKNKNKEGNENPSYRLDVIYSETILERYVAQLLALYPFLDLNRSDWTDNDLIGLMKTYFTNMESTAVEANSSLYLKNALFITQSIIAQETLLAGEPLLEGLYEVAPALLGSAPYVQSEKLNIQTYNAVRSNRLLTRNLLSYFLWKKIQSGGSELTFESYQNAILKKDFSFLAKVLGVIPYQLNIDAENGELILTVNNMLIPLPNLEDLKKGTILYSENMQRVVKIQDRLLEALAKKSPLLSRVEKLGSLLIVQSLK